MKLRYGWLLAIMLTAALFARAATPEERYIQIYGIMREGDGLVTANQGRAALQKYEEAARLLRLLQQSEPSWNPIVVSYRLEQLDTQIKKLTAQSPAAEAVPVAAPRTPAEIIKSLQEMNTRLAQANVTLEAKLKEALSVQPSAADPRELAKAQEQINALLKERDLLRISVEQLRNSARPATASNTADAQALAEAQKQLAQQAALAASLREQNDSLQRQLTQSKAASPDAEPAVDARLKAAQDEIANLQAANRTLQAEVTTLKSAPPPTTSAASSKEVEKLERQLARANAATRSAEAERDDLKTRYEEARKELRGKLPPDTAAKLEEQARQLTVMRARLEAYEARPVPLSPEEQALVKQAPTPKLMAAAVTDTNQAKHKIELPRGSAPLFNEAQRAIDAKRFDDAEQKLKQVLSQDENNVYVLATLSGVQLDLNKPDEAEKNLTKALTVDAHDAASLYLMGSLKLSQEKYDEALDSLSQAVQLAPDNVMAQYNLGRTLVLKGNTKAAETSFRKAISLKPNWGDAHYQLAVIYLTGNPPFRELARWHYQKAISGGVPRNFELERRLENPSATKP